MVRGKGCRVWDVEGREFIDFRNGLGPVTLGYAYKEVNDAIAAMLEQGVVFGHPHTLECETAELISKVIPCAQKVRFLKTGGEAISACIRLARAYTGRDHIVQIGYNGWLNVIALGGLSLPGAKPGALPPGIPAAISALHHAGEWNNIAQIEQWFKALPDGIAAVVVAADYAGMDAGSTFLPALRELTERYGALLIMDEIVTGFRIALAGAQQHFNVMPDLAVFAKGLANGLPLSVYCGRAEVMDRLQQVTVSSTYGGETLSLAAARKTIAIYQRDNVVDHLWRIGELMWQSLNRIFEQHKLPITIKGFWPCPQFVIGKDAPPDLEERFFRAAYRNGVSLYRVSYVNYSHKEADIREALDRLKKAIAELGD